MAPGFQRFVSTLLFALMSSLALPASAMDWPYWRAGDLKRGVETLSTRQDASHTVPISVCAPGEAFVCLRFSSSGGLAVPKGKKLPESWEFEGWRYQVVERNASLMLLGELVEGVYIRTSAPDNDAFEFLYSPTRGFIVFQMMETPRTPKGILISARKCAIGAARSCRDK